MTTYITASFVR